MDGSTLWVLDGVSLQRHDSQPVKPVGNDRNYGEDYSHALYKLQTTATVVSLYIICYIYVAITRC